jgi:Na+/H+ antiporter family
LRTLDTYILKALADEDHVYIILFDYFLAGLMGVIQRVGGANGLAKAILSFAKTRRMTMLVAFLCGFAIFFDDYANTLILGSTFRPIFDAMLISREKLAFIVDATAAPIASISPISSWIGELPRLPLHCFACAFRITSHAHLTALASHCLRIWLGCKWCAAACFQCSSHANSGHVQPACCCPGTTAALGAGFELSLIDDAYTAIDEDGGNLAGRGWETPPFLVFVQTIPGRFYPWAMLRLQLMLILTQRDLGSMWKAERRAIQEKKVHADDASTGQVRCAPTGTCGTCNAQCMGCMRMRETLSACAAASCA